MTLWLFLISVRFYRKYIVKTAKALVEVTKLLVAGGIASQEKTAKTAQSPVSTLT